MFIKNRLLTPGPTATAESTRLTLASDHPHHRSPQYKEMHVKLLERLCWLWDTDDDVIFVTGSGTAGMEAGMRTTLRADDTIVVVTGGKFGQRWLKIAKRISDHVVELPVDWGQTVDLERAAEALRSLESVDALVCVASETSTGVQQPVAELSQLLQEHTDDALFLVDGITAVGTVDLSMKRHHIDVLVSGTQKAFGLPPGGAMVGMSSRAWEASQRSGCTEFYLDLRREQAQINAGKPAYTPAVGLTYALDAVMKQWQEVGREQLFEHAEQLAKIFRAGVDALGLDLFTKGPASPALTAVEMPKGVSAVDVTTWLRDELGITMSAGQAELKERIVRVGHIGAVDGYDMLQAVGALETALDKWGADCAVGQGVAAAQQVLNKTLTSSNSYLYSP